MDLIDWGLISYEDAWKRQTEMFDEVIARKLAGEPFRNTIIACQHPHVYTLGRSGKAANMLMSEQQLQSIGATLFHIDRGGDITYHGPGQLVVYPIIDLDSFKLGLKDYIHALEQAVISLCGRYGIRAHTLAGATGVWLDPGLSTARKICAIGVRASHFVTMHGLALNVNTDLRYFSYINPCGFVDKGVTSLQKELGRPIDMAQLRDELMQDIVVQLKTRNL